MISKFSYLYLMMGTSLSNVYFTLSGSQRMMNEFTTLPKSGSDEYDIKMLVQKSNCLNIRGGTWALLSISMYIE